MKHDWSNLKVALETSYIGHGFVDPEGKTGIYRVAMELTKRMLARSDLKLFFTFLFLPHSMTPTIEHFMRCGYQVDTLFKNRSYEDTIYDYLLKLPQFPHKYGVMLYLATLFQWPKRKKLPRDIDIFHSLYHPLPSFIDSIKHLRFVTVHDIIGVLFPQYATKFQTRRIKRLLKNIDIENDWAICVSQCTKDDLCEATGMSEDRVFVIYLGASKHAYHPIRDADKINDARRRFGIPEHKDYFLSVATIEPRKNLSFTLRCFKKILHEPGLSDMYFVIVGKRGWKVEGLFSEISSDPILRQRVILTGFVEDCYLASIYNGALAFLYPSLYEGFGLPALEAMQCGTPVITSNVSSLPEVVGDAGIMIDPRDEDGLCQAMIDIARDSKLRRRLSIKGIERAKLFSWDKCVDETINAYKFALENR
ncbi:MAG: glycosyltransferase family 1 protein [Candidatus Aenigmatarchaeota archaeon]|nr:MAG: glycosyltransferase family 1 protein [Candidatus Aenigmarchaeota archaeon]